MGSNIDIVITWVDNNDPQWIKEYEHYSGKKVDGVRFEDTGTLKYIFRGIEKFMPWVRKVHFVTYGHYPKWLNLKHPKLNMVKHSDIFPNTDVLPVFNSFAIEMNFHRIDGLSEQFIYFNDDMFVLKKLTKEHFFIQGLPNDFYVVQSLFHDELFSHVLHSDMQVINKEIQKNSSFKKQLSRVLTLKFGWKAFIRSVSLLIFGKQIPLFELYHHPQAHLKSNFIEVERSYPEIIEKTRTYRFRTCASTSQYLFRFWGLIKGKYNPKKYADAYYIGVNNLDVFAETLAKLKIRGNPSFVCFNEESAFPTDQYESYKNIIIQYLDEILAKKSTWEI